MSELIPFSLLSMGLSFIGIGFLLPFYKEGSSFLDETLTIWGFFYGALPNWLKKGHTLLCLGSHHYFPYFWGSSAKRGGGRGTTPRLWCENEVRNHGTQTLKCISHPQNILKVTRKGVWYQMFFFAWEPEHKSIFHGSEQIVSVSIFKAEQKCQ